MKQQSDIDFVITWVDGTDPVWQKEKAAYSGQEDIQALAAYTDFSKVRYRNHGLLLYWFRGVEQFAPWVRKIHFVTCGHLPPWLDVSNPKLNIVRHDEFIPKVYLPTFNSNAIEMHMHRIKGLSDNFVYFNDDMFLIRPAKETDFFRAGKPCDLLAFQPVVANPANPVMSHLLLNDILVISKYFNKRENVKKQLGKYFNPGYPLKNLIYNMIEVMFPKYTGFFSVHGPVPFCKQTFEELWEKEGDQLSQTSSHRFRSKDDLTIYLLREWQKLTGNFHAKNVDRFFKYFELAENNYELHQTIAKQKKKIICINDVNDQIDFDQINKKLSMAFEEILPKKSSFEKV